MVPIIVISLSFANITCLLDTTTVLLNRNRKKNHIDQKSSKSTT